MKTHSVIVSIVAFVAALTACQICFAWSSSELNQEDDGLFDDWHICRTDIIGDEGFLQVKETLTEVSFRPVIAMESLGEYADVAYEMGEQFVQKYPDRIQRARKIFEFVRDSIQYTPDIDQYDMLEYAQNADEMARILQEKGQTSADCEEYAVLLAVMYQGAGYRSGIALCPGHAAAILYLPEYEKANMSFTLNGDEGWIWLEATGKNNPFGWFPQGQVEGPILGYEVSPDEHLPFYKPQPPMLDTIGDKEANEGDTVHFTICATDVNDDPLTYAASHLPPGASFDADTRVFNWTPDKAGLFSDIHFEVSDGQLTDTEDINIFVYGINQAPVLDYIGDREVKKGERLLFTVSATDVNDDPLTYSASNLPPGASFDPDTRVFIWTPDEVGIFSDIYFEVSDSQLTDSEKVNITVKGRPNLTLIGIISGIGVAVLIGTIIFWRKMRRAQ